MINSPLFINKCLKDKYQKELDYLCRQFNKLAYDTYLSNFSVTYDLNIKIDEFSSIAETPQVINLFFEMIENSGWTLVDWDLKPNFDETSPKCLFIKISQ